MKNNRIELKKTSSTSTYIKEHLNDIQELTFVYAEEQTDGHGRFTHTWESENGKNILTSFLIKDREITSRFCHLSIFLGTVIKETLEQFGITNIYIKWPNDIIVNNKKICGILLEGKLPEYIIVGIGLNVNQINHNLDTAISMINILNTEIPLYIIKKTLEKNIKLAISKFKQDKYDYISIFNKCDYLIDKKITFVYQNKTLSGIAKGIDASGNLLVKYNGQILKLSSGEISLIR